MCTEYDDDTDHNKKTLYCVECGQDFCEDCCADGLRCPNCGNEYDQEYYEKWKAGGIRT